MQTMISQSVHIYIHDTYAKQLAIHDKQFKPRAVDSKATELHSN